MEQEERNNQPQSDGNNGSIQSEAHTRKGHKGSGGTPDAGSSLRASQRDAAIEARRRMQQVAESVAEAEALAPAPLHDTFLDERNDVMSVINELEEQLDRHQDVRERLERDLKEANERAQGAAQHTQELEWQVVTLQTRVEALEQLRQEVSLLEEELATANAQLQAANEEQGRSEKERTRLRNELKTANKQLEELWALRKERDGLRSDVASLTARIEELDRAQRELTDERGALAARLKETAVALEEARGERHSTNSCCAPPKTAPANSPAFRKSWPTSSKPCGPTRRPCRSRWASWNARTRAWSSSDNSTKRNSLRCATPAAVPSWPCPASRRRSPKCVSP